MQRIRTSLRKNQNIDSTGVCFSGSWSTRTCVFLHLFLGSELDIWESRIEFGELKRSVVKTEYCQNGTEDYVAGLIHDN
jgi:hypothetical protein